MSKPIFTKDYFTKTIPLWEKHLGHLREVEEVRYLEIGTFEGRSLIWMLDNILTGVMAGADVVDPFDRGFEFQHEGENFREIEVRFRKNLKPYRGRFTLWKEESSWKLKELSADYYDVIYIDGVHRADYVLEDAILSMRLLKQRGIMVFDDYRWKKEGMEEWELPRTAIDIFISIYRSKFEVLEKRLASLLKEKITLKFTLLYILMQISAGFEMILFIPKFS